MIKMTEVTTMETKKIILKLRTERGMSQDDLADMDFIIICTYEKDGENPELLIYKKRY